MLFFFFVIEVKESEVSIGYVYLQALYAMHHIYFTNLGCHYFFHITEKETEDHRLNNLPRVTP